MENMLATNPTSTSMLWRRIKNAEKAWTEFEGQYDWLRTIAGQGQLQDQVQAKQDLTCIITLQHRYLEVHACTEDALDNDQNAEEARLKELKDNEDVCLELLTSQQKVHQYTARWKGVHHCIDKSLGEIKASLEGNAINCLEVLKVKEDQLVQVNENFKESPVSWT